MNLSIRNLFVFSSILLLHLLQLIHGTNDIPDPLNKSMTYPNHADLVLGILLPLHSSRQAISGEQGNMDVCYKMKNMDGIQPLEALLNALDEINSSPSILPTITLGGVVLDSCNSPDIAITQTIKIIKGFLASENKYHSEDFVCSDGSAPVYHDGYYDKVVGIIGEQQSDITIQMAQITKLFKVPQISYLSTSSLLSKKDKFPYFLRTVPDDNYQAEVILSVMKQQNWRHASLIYSDTDYGISGKNALLRKSEEFQVCFIEPVIALSASSGREEFVNATKLIRKRASKVVVVFADADTTSRLMEVVAVDGHGIHFTWIGSDGWTLRDAVTKDRMRIIEGAIAVQPRAMKIPGFDSHFTGLTPENNKRNIWFREFWSDYFDCSFGSNHLRKRCDEMFFDLSASSQGHSYFQVPWLHFLRDAVVAYGQALHNMWSARCRPDEGVCEAMAHAGHIHGKDLFNYLLNVTFKDVAGEDFKFTSTRSGLPRYTIYNYQYTGSHFIWKKIGNYSWKINKEVETPDLHLETQELLKYSSDEADNPDGCKSSCRLGEALVYLEDSCCAKCNECDKTRQIVNSTSLHCQTCDRCDQPNYNWTMCVPKEIKDLDYRNQWAITAMAVAGIGIFSTVLVGIIFWIHLDTPIIKAASRELSYTLLSGIFLSFCMTFFIVSPPNPYTCGITRFFTGFSYTVCYAAILTKTNRIYRIFKKSHLKAQKTKFTSSTSMMIIVGLIVSVEVLINITWVLYDQPDSIVLCPLEKNYSLRICKGMVEYSYIIGFIYPFCLVCICTIYAIKTRKCPEGFNEARYIAFTNYSTCIIWVVFVPLYISTGSEEAVRIVSLALSLSLGGFVQLGCLFFPKVHVVLFKPEKNTRDAVMSQGRGSSSGIIDGLSPGKTEMHYSAPTLILNSTTANKGMYLRNNPHLSPYSDGLPPPRRPNTLPSVSAIAEEMYHDQPYLQTPPGQCNEGYMINRN